MAKINPEVVRMGEPSDPPTQVSGAKSCPVCGSIRLVSTGIKNGYDLVRCRSCTHAFVAGDVSSAVEQAYGQEYYQPSVGSTEAPGYSDYLGKADQRIAAFETRLAQVERFATTRGTLLDYGCAVGLFVKVAQENGWQAIGYERSGWAARYGRDVLGLDIREPQRNDVPFERNTFDMVTMWDALEHLERPREVLHDIALWLKPGAYLALNTINASSLGAQLAGIAWRHVVPPQHLQYFTRRSLATLLTDAGFQVVALSSSGTCFASAAGAPNRADWRNKLDGLVRYWRIRQPVTRLGLLDEVDIIARKRAQAPSVDTSGASRAK